MVAEEERWWPCSWKLTRRYIAFAYGTMAFALGLVILSGLLLGAELVLLAGEAVLLLVVTVMVLLGFGSTSISRYDRGILVEGEYSVMRGQVFLRTEDLAYYDFFRPTALHRLDGRGFIVRAAWWKGAYIVRLPSDEASEDFAGRTGAVMSIGPRSRRNAPEA